MGWGAPLGFSSGKSPFERVSSAKFGEEGWYLRVSAKPTDEYQDRMILMTPCARAVFNNADHASLWVNHGGELGVMANHYLELLVESCGGDAE